MAGHEERARRVPEVARVTERTSPDADGSTGQIASARQKFHCPACGAEANWNPAKQALICPFCGTESPATLTTRGADTLIVEHDLAAALRAIPDSARGWQTPKISVRCQSCQAISVFDADVVGRRCDFCGSTALVPYEEVKDPFRPESLLPLKISESQARDLIRGWYGRQWLAPNNLNAKALTDTVKGIYLPYWTFDAKADARWSAEAGTFYYVRENNRNVQKVRWTPASGALSHVFDDELVCASVGVDPGKLRRIEPFPTTSLVPFDPGYLAGWTVERYQIDLVAAAERSRQQMHNELQRLCAQQVPGDTQRNLVVDATFHDQTFKHILAPVWLMTYVYGAKSYQVVVNGVTGTIAGSRPYSWIKVTLLVLALLMVFLLYAYNSQ
jgi:Zn finger protein HypA/HybF involved in hydrogenase expression